MFSWILVLTMDLVHEFWVNNLNIYIQNAFRKR